MSKNNTSFIRFDPLKRVVFSEKHTGLTGEDTWVVSGCLSYYIGARKNEHWVCVPNGYRITNSCLPDPFKNWIKPWESDGHAAIVHNYLCKIGLSRINGERVILSRRAANKVFFEAMSALGVPLWKRTILYLAACWQDNSDEVPCIATA